MQNTIPDIEESQETDIKRVFARLKVVLARAEQELNQRHKERLYAEIRNLLEDELRDLQFWDEAV